MKKICLLLQMLAVIFGAQAQTERYTVYALRFASAAHPFPISDWADKGPKTDSVSIDFMVWLVKGAGKNILVGVGKDSIKPGRYHGYYPHSPALGPH